MDNRPVTNFSGYIGAHPEVTMLPSGVVKITFSVATNYTTIDSQTGNTSEQVQWNTCTCIGEYAKTLSHYLKSGTFVVIQGRVLLNQWVDKVTQEKRSRTVIGIDSCTFVETVKRTPQYQAEESEQPAPQPKATRAQPAKKTPAPKPQTPVYAHDLEDDLPF